MRLVAVDYLGPDRVAGHLAVTASVGRDAHAIVLEEGVVLIHRHDGQTLGIPLHRCLAVYVAHPPESVGFATGFVEIPAVRDFEVPALFGRIAAWLRR